MKKKMTDKIKFNISILNKNKDFKFSDKNLIKKIFKLLLENVEINNKTQDLFKDINSVALDFVFCSDKDIREINREYRNINKETDVITFALFADCDDCMKLGDEINLGEIIISVETAKKQAKTTFEEEIQVLITHGILHLLGFDHQNKKDYNFIVNVQNDILEELRNGKIQNK